MEHDSVRNPESRDASCFYNYLWYTENIRYYIQIDGSIYMKPTNLPYKYPSTWKAIPIDGSAMEWAKEFGCQRLTISAALKAVKKEGADEKDSLYQQIRQSRRTSREKAGNKADTHPGKYYWELKPLIRALSQARKAKRGLSGDDLAEGAFQRLAAELLDDDLTQKSFHQIQLVNNRCVRERILRKYQNEVATRLDAIKFLTTHKPDVAQMNESKLDNVLIERIQVACEALDTLLYKLLLIPDVEDTSVDTLINRSLRAADIETNGHKSATIDDIFELYEALKAQRPHTDSGEYSDDNIVTEFSVSDERITAELMNALDARKTPQNRPLEPRVRERIECAYNNYLLASMPSANREQAEKFLDKISELQEFMESKKNFEDYKPQLESLLYKEVSFVFKDLKNLTRIDYAYLPPKAPTLETMALRESIKNQNQHMRRHIHYAIAQLLRGMISMNLIKETGIKLRGIPNFILLPEIQTEKIAILIKYMQDEYKELVKKTVCYLLAIR